MSYNKLTVNQLKAKLEEKGLPKSGNKAVLLTRLKNASNLTKSLNSLTIAELKLKLKSLNLSTTGNKSVLIKRLEENMDENKLSKKKTKSKTIRDYSTFKVVELKEELGKRKLPKTGNKNVLVKRLLDDDKETKKPSPTKKISSPEGKYENLVKKRDKKYYEVIKPIVENLPPLLGLRMFGEMREKVIQEWDTKKKWRAIYEDFVALDSAATEFDTQFIDLIANYDSKMAKKRNKPERFLELKKYKSLADKSPKDVKRFFATYPYLSYILLQTEPLMTLYAVEAGELDYVTKPMLQKHNYYEIAIHIHDTKTAEYLDDMLNLFVRGYGESLITRGSYELLKYLKDRGNEVPPDRVNDLFKGIDIKKIDLLLTDDMITANRLVLYSLNGEYIEQLSYIFNNYNISDKDLKWLFEKMLMKKRPGERSEEYRELLQDVYDQVIKQNIILDDQLLAAAVYAYDIEYIEKIINNMDPNLIGGFTMGALDGLISRGPDDFPYMQMFELIKLNNILHRGYAKALLEAAMYKKFILVHLLENYPGIFNDKYIINGALTYGALYGSYDSMEYLLKNYEFKQNVLNTANIKAYQLGRTDVAFLLERYGAIRPQNPEKLLQPRI